MAYEAAEHGLMATACKADGGHIVLAKKLKVVTINDFVFAVVGETRVEVGEAGQGVVDGFGGLVDEVEGFFCWGLSCCGLCCHDYSIHIEAYSSVGMDWQSHA